MEKQELLKQCKVYNGDNVCPDNIMNTQYGFMFWEAEQLFVEKQDPFFVKSVISSFLSCGLAGEAMSIPIQLRACLFAAFCKGSDTDPKTLAVYFKANVLPKYLELP